MLLVGIRSEKGAFRGIKAQERDIHDPCGERGKNQNNQVSREICYATEEEIGMRDRKAGKEER